MAIYYISSSYTGSNGTSNGTQSRPYITLSSLPALAPGDTVYLKRDDTFILTTTFTITASGTSASRITFDAYGTGALPVITSFVTATGWTAHGTISNVWVSSAISAISVANVVVRNTTMERMGRWPNYNTTNGGYLFYGANKTSTTITDATNLTGASWNGADVVLRTSHFSLDHTKITNHDTSTGTLTFSSSGLYGGGPKSNFGYFIQNHINTLDQDGEWFFDSNKKLNMYMTGGAPTNVRVATLSNIFSVTGNYITIQNLRFEGATSVAVEMNSSSNSQLTNIEVQYAYTGISGGVSPYTVDGAVVRDCLNLTLNNGSAGAVVRNSKFYNAGLLHGMNGNGAGIPSVNMTGDGAVLDKCVIDGAGYNGFKWSLYAFVTNCYVTNFCRNRDDGGGIYSRNVQTVGGVDTYPAIMTNFQITGNTVTYDNSTECAFGTDTPNVSIYGIYLDDGENNSEISYNTVSGVPSGGIYLHNCYNINIHHNNLYDNMVAWRVQQDQTTQLFQNMQFKNNNIVCKTANQLAYSLYLNSDYFADATNDFDNNVITRPTDDDVLIFLNHSGVGAGTTKYYSLAQWKSVYGKDLNSTGSPVAGMIEYTINSLVGNTFTSASSGAFTTGTFGTTTGTNGSVTRCALTWENTAGVLDAGYQRVDATGARSQVVYNAGGSAVFDPAKYYIFRCSLKSNIANKSVGIMLRAPSPTFAVISEQRRRTCTTSRNDVECLFKPTQSTSAGSGGIIVNTEESDADYNIDNIYISEASVTIKSDNFLFYSNPAATTMNVNVGSSIYKDPSGSVYTGNVAVSPYGSLILLNTGTTDSTAPTPGSSGALTKTGSSSNGFTLNWTKATDNIAPASQLVYKIYRSTTTNVNSLATIGSATLIGTDIDVNSALISGLAPGMHYFNVVVEDPVGNKALYTMTSYEVGSPTGIRIKGRKKYNG